MKQYKHKIYKASFLFHGRQVILRSGTFISRAKTVAPKRESSASRSESSAPRAETSISRTKTFTSRAESFAPRSETFISRAKTFTSRAESFILRAESFIPGNGTSASGSESITSRSLQIVPGSGTFKKNIQYKPFKYKLIMADYVPSGDAEFNLWQASLMEIAEPMLTDWGIPADTFTALQTTQATWTSAFDKASNKQNRTSADVQAKNDARESYEKELREFVAQWLANNSSVSNSERERMGLTIRSDSRTAAPVPSTRPVGTIDFSVRLQHTIHFTDEATPRSKAKPTGVYGCEIWMKLDGDAPVDNSELTYLATDTCTPYVATFEGADAGKIVYYWLRWINTRGEHGPWSSTFSAMIVG